jgi:hypothetical protein
MSEARAGIEGFIEWLERQDPTTEYRWASFDDCLICRFAHAVSGDKTLTFCPSTKVADLPTGFIDKVVAAAAERDYRNYGSALQRARAFVVDKDQYAGVDQAP